MADPRNDSGGRFSDAPGAPARTRIAAVAVVAAVHVLIVILVIRALAAAPAETGGEPVSVAAYDVALPPPPPPPPAPSASATKAEGKAAPAARRAQAKAVSAPPARIPTPAMTAAPVSSTGDESRSGAAAAGAGTGGGGNGMGTGSGGAGNGEGGRHVAQRAVKIAGDITSARDYPAAGRDQRLGTSVVIALTVEPDGSVGGCRVVRPSGDDEADRITCQLARSRFRFRPALDQYGQPIESVFGWQQRWFRP